ncbi:MAG TPA: SUF system Fe-S cluster assembly regulator [Gammaproteobacteria bacterium]|nr:SUF system Fe-S cluster assembly regulator [Gammaproteobacteria bacterium]
MLRVGKLTDYATVVMTHLACDPARLQSAAEIATELGLALPTVSKILKALLQHGLLVSHRGAKGGYTLARPPAEISVAAIIAAIEGPIALTECSDSDGLCDQERGCSVRGNWQRINRAVSAALEGVTLAELAEPGVQPLRFMRPGGSPV